MRVVLGYSIAASLQAFRTDPDTVQVIGGEGGMVRRNRLYKSTFMWHVLQRECNLQKRGHSERVNYSVSVKQ